MGSNKITENCNIQPCPGNMQTPHKLLKIKLILRWFLKNYLKENYLIFSKVDCKWNEWEEGLCSKECGGGIRTNIRTFNQTAAHGGKNCSGPSEIIENCNIWECPGKERVSLFLVLRWNTAYVKRKCFD